MYMADYASLSALRISIRENTPARNIRMRHTGWATPKTLLALEPIAGAEQPPHDRQAKHQEQPRHGKADADAHVGDLEEAPAEAADQVDHRIEQGDGLPGRRQHADRIEAAAQERQRRDDEQRHDLQLFEPVGPDADDEAEQAEADGR